jgi:hypothetical protein
MRQAGDFATGCRFPYQCGTVLTSRGQIATIAWVECQRRDPRAVGGEAALPALAEDAHGLGLRRCGRRAVHPVPARPIRRSAPAMAPALAKGRCGGEPSPLDQGTDLRLLQRAARCLGEGRHQRALLPVPYPKIPIGRIPAALDGGLVQIRHHAGAMFAIVADRARCGVEHQAGLAFRGFDVATRAVALERRFPRREIN